RQTRRAAGRPRRRQHDDDCRRAGCSQRILKTDRLADADGHRAARQAHRRALTEDRRRRAALVARRPRLRRLGHLRGRLLRGSTEIFATESPAHQSIEAFERALEQNDPAIPSSMVYAYAAIREGIPYANAAPNLTADIPALVDLAAKTKSPLAGKDLKTGQTLIKTIIAPGLKARLIGVEGWYSTNILGNRDGEVLDDPESFKTKEESKKSVLDY